MQAEVREHAPYLAVLALDQNDPDAARADPVDRTRAVALPFYRNAVGEGADKLVRNVPRRLDDVLFLNPAAWMPQLGGEGAVVCEQDQPAGHEIQPADAVHALAYLRWQKPKRQRPPLRVGGRAYVARRLVQRDVQAPALWAKRLAVQQHGVVGKDPASLRSNRGAVHADPALRDDLLRRAPGRDAGARHVNVEPDAVAVRDSAPATISIVGSRAPGRRAAQDQPSPSSSKRSMSLSPSFGRSAMELRLKHFKNSLVVPY